jgi:N,N-dimethylformamidase
VRAGSRVALHLSSSDRHPAVSVVRLDLEPVSTTAWAPTVLKDSIEPGAFEQGSWLELPWSSGAFEQVFQSLSVEFWLTRNTGTRTLLAGAGFQLDVNEGRVILRNGETAATPATALVEKSWYVLNLSRSGAQMPELKISRFGSEECSVHMSVPTIETGPGHSWALGASFNSQQPTLNVRIGRVILSTSKCVVRWSFTPHGGQAELWPSAGEWAPMRVHNNPTFAVPSARWDGSVLNPRDDGAHYDAIHLHDDDLGDCTWDASHELDVPTTAPSGIYAFEVVTTAGTERIPFFVRPLRPSAPLVFLAPTATYVAYGNEYLPQATYPWRCWDRGHQFAQDNELRSLYDIHSDRSGVSLSTGRRPQATIRDDYTYPLSNSPHLLPVDLHLLRFCHSNGIEIDVLTDHDLHAEGHDALLAYAGVVTGSHPEYWSSPMMLALDRYLCGGGSLAYLGGNGFYLAIAFEGDQMELRRDSNDSIWRSDPGERYMALSGEAGGYWESQGHPPQSLVGSTFLMMGFGSSRPYRRLAASYRDEWAWIFDTVDERPIGDSGIVLGGAAGYEVDGVIERMHTPPSLVRLATAGDFDVSFEVRDPLPSAIGAAERAQFRRADMTIYRHTGGGLVFSVGSVAWCGALPFAGGRNAVGAITLNIAKRFAQRTGNSRDFCTVRSAKLE